MSSVTGDPPAMGRLAHVNLRDVSAHEAHEAHDFTPWLLANADVLGEALGMDLVLERAEHPVGGYSLDLIGIDEATGETVIVENQLALPPTTRIWARSSRTPVGPTPRTSCGSRCASATSTAPRSTGSTHAPTGPPASSPSRCPSSRSATPPLRRSWNWSPSPTTGARRCASHRRRSARRARRTGRSGPLAGAHSRGAADLDQRPPTAAAELDVDEHGGERPDLQRVLQQGGPSCELYFGSSYPDVNLARFRAAESRREELEAAFGGPVDFDELPTRKACRIAVYRPGNINNRSEWDSYLQWYLEIQTRLRGAVDAVGGVRALIGEEPSG